MKITLKELRKMIQEQISKEITLEQMVQQTEPDLNRTDRSSFKQSSAQKPQKPVGQKVSPPALPADLDPFGKKMVGNQKKIPASVQGSQTKMGMSPIVEQFGNKMKISKKQLEETVKKMVKENFLSSKKQLSEAAVNYSDLFPGAENGELVKFVEKVDKFLMETCDKATELKEEAEKIMRPNMFGGDSSASPSATTRVGERNRVLMVRAGLLKKLCAACVSMIEFARREG